MSEHPISLPMGDLTNTLADLKRTVADYDQAVAEHDGGETVVGVHTLPFVERTRTNLDFLNKYLDVHYQDSKTDDAQVIAAVQEAERQIAALREDIVIFGKTSVLRN